LVVSGGDIYAAGHHDFNLNIYDNYNTGYWKNGTWVGLKPLDIHWGAGANSLAVSGNDVFAGGDSGNSSGAMVPGCWINGTWTAVGQGDYGSISVLVLYQNDIYAGGFATNASNHTAAGYWKNGIWVGLKPLAADNSWVQALVIK
jgi:hypothetical protein